MWVPSGVSPKIGVTYSGGGGTARSVALALPSTMSVMSAVLRDRDRILRTVRRGEASLLAQVVGQVAFDQEHRLAEVVDVEELRRESVTAVVTLALPGVEMNSHEGNLRPDQRRLTSQRYFCAFSYADSAASMPTLVASVGYTCTSEAMSLSFMP